MIDFLSFIPLVGNFYILFFLTFSLYPKEINITKIFSWVLSRWVSIGFGKLILDIICKCINIVEAVKCALREHGDDGFIVENGCKFIEKFLTKDNNSDAVASSALIFQLLEKHRNDRNLTITAILNLIIGTTLCDQLTTRCLIESDNFLQVLVDIAKQCFRDKNLDVLRHVILCLESISIHSDESKVQLINLDILRLLLGVLEFSTDSGTVKGCLCIIAGLLLNNSDNVFNQVPEADLKGAITKVRIKFIRDNAVLSVAIEVWERLKPGMSPLLSPNVSFMSSQSRSEGEATITSLQPDMLVDSMSQQLVETVSQQLGTWLQEKQLQDQVDSNSVEKLTALYQAELAEKGRTVDELTESLRQSSFQLSTLADEKEQLSLLLEKKQTELQLQTSQSAKDTHLLEQQLHDTRVEVDRLQATAKDLEMKNAKMFESMRSEKDAQIVQLTEQQKAAQEKIDQLNAKLSSRESESNLLTEACKKADSFKEQVKELKDSLNSAKLRTQVLDDDKKRLNADLEKQKSINKILESEKQRLLNEFAEEKRKLSVTVQDLHRSLQNKDSDFEGRLQAQRDELNAVKAEEQRELEDKWAEEKQQLLSDVILLTVGGRQFNMRRSICPQFVNSIENQFAPPVDGRYNIQRDATQFSAMLLYLETTMIPTDLHSLSLLREELLFYDIALPADLVETWDANFSSHNFPSITDTFSIDVEDQDRYTICAIKALTSFSLRIQGIGASNSMRVGFRFPCTEEFCGAILLELPQSIKPKPNNAPVEPIELQVSYNPDNQSIHLSSVYGQADLLDIFNRRDRIYVYRFRESEATVTEYVGGQCSQRRVHRWSLEPCAHNEELMRKQLTLVKPPIYPLVECGGCAMTVSIVNGR